MYWPSSGTPFRDKTPAAHPAKDFEYDGSTLLSISSDMGFGTQRRDSPVGLSRPWVEMRSFARQDRTDGEEDGASIDSYSGIGSSEPGFYAGVGQDGNSSQHSMVMLAPKMPRRSLRNFSRPYFRY